MIKKYFAVFAGLLALSLAPVSISADVVLTFDNDLEGFVNDAGTSVQHSTNFGGSMKITMPGGSDVFDASLSSAILNFTAADPIAVEMANAAANGGTLSFDFHMIESEQTLTGGAPGLVEAAIVTTGNFADRSIGLVGFPAAGQTSTTNFSFDIVAGTEWDFNATNSNLIYQDNGTGSFAFGLKDQNGAFATTMFYIDNFTVVAAVPEPSAATLIALSGLGLALVRRRERTTKS